MSWDCQEMEIVFQIRSCKLTHLSAEWRPAAVVVAAAAFLPQLVIGNLLSVIDKYPKYHIKTVVIKIEHSSLLPLSTIIGFLCASVNAVTRVENQSSRQFNHLLDYNETSLPSTSNLLGFVLLKEIVIIPAEHDASKQRSKVRDGGCL